MAQLMDWPQELTRLQKLVQLPSIQEALKDKFSRFDADLNPTHDHQGNELESKVICMPACKPTISGIMVASHHCMQG